MESFNQCLRMMQHRCVIRDAEYWDLKLLKDEIPISEECNETKLSVTFQGFNIFMEFREDSLYSTRLFHAFVQIPKDFNHDPLDFSGIIDPAIIYPYPEGYGWSYRYYDDANLFRPLELQNRHCVPSGPVQIMETCRALIQEFIHKKHKTPTETFRRNLKWMQQKCSVLDAEYWDLKLKEGETIISPPRNEKSITLHKDDFIITIKGVGSGFPRYFCGSIQVNEFFNVELDSTLQTLQTIPYENREAKGGRDSLYEWNHNDKDTEVDFSLPLRSDTQFIQGTDRLKRVSGPVQILDEARQIIHAIKREKKRCLTESIREELMMKTCHPKRMAAWVHQGFDPFQED